MNRLDYTRTGRWRLITAPQAPAEPDSEDADPLPEQGFEVEEMDAAKWHRFAPLFARWSGAAD